MTDHAAAQTTPAQRIIPARLSTGAAWWKRWEAILIVVAVVIFALNSFASPYFLDPSSLSLATFNFTEKAIIGFAMALLIIAGERIPILSVASIIAISSVAMGAANAYRSARRPRCWCSSGSPSASSPAPSTASSSPASACPRSSSPSAR